MYILLGSDDSLSGLVDTVKRQRAAYRESPSAHGKPLLHLPRGHSVDSASSPRLDHVIPGIRKGGGELSKLIVWWGRCIVNRFWRCDPIESIAEAVFSHAQGLFEDAWAPETRGFNGRARSGFSCCEPPKLSRTSIFLSVSVSSRRPGLRRVTVAFGRAPTVGREP